MVDWNTCLERFEARTAALHPRVRPVDFRHAIIVSPRYNYLYVNVPKAACTTIRKLLIDAEFGEVRPYAERSDTLHYNEFLPFLNVWQLGDFERYLHIRKPFVFTFVRNPYTRLLSAYLDKIVGRKPERNVILRQLGRSHRPEEDISFADFVKTVCTTPPTYQNAHWRPQYDQTFQEGLTYDLIGRFENLETNLREVAERVGINAFITPETFGRPGEGSRHHATGAGAQVETHFTEDLRKLVYMTYRKDFDTFGYSADL